jgi:hypothetical protein
VVIGDHHHWRLMSYYDSPGSVSVFLRCASAFLDRPNGLLTRPRPVTICCTLPGPRRQRHENSVIRGEYWPSGG